MRALIVDDEPAIRDLVAMAAQAVDGLETIDHADSTDMAIELLQREPSPQFVIADLSMPGNGLRLLETLKADFPHIPIIVFTGYPKLLTAMDAVRTGVFDFLEKPFDRDKMIRSMRRAIASQASKSAIPGWIQTSADLGLITTCLFHQLASPLSVVRGYSQLLHNLFLDGRVGDPVGRKYVQEISLQSQQLIEMVAAIRALFTQTDQDMKVLALSRLIMEAVRLCEIHAYDLGIDVALGSLDSEGVVFGNYHQIQQALLCLLLNSLQAHRENSLRSKTRGIGHHSARWIRAEIQESEKFLSIVVTDNAGGISESILPFLFQPFASGRQTGTGLGLHLAQRVMGRHGGCARGVSRADGSSFYLDFPIHNASNEMA